MNSLLDAERITQNMRRSRGPQRAERFSKPWLCDCHTWPDPDEAHAYIVALEEREKGYLETLARLRAHGEFVHDHVVVSLAAQRAKEPSDAR